MSTFKTIGKFFLRKQQQKLMEDCDNDNERLPLISGPQRAMEDAQKNGTDALSVTGPWWRGAGFKIYVSHTLSSWGDRMWSFALGIYLYYLDPSSLQLTAIYGFTSCISVILLGAVIGKWIDRSQRLRAAQVSLLVQNLAVTICAALIVVKLQFAEHIDPIWNGALEVIFIGVVILFGVIADLGSVATKIALEKDWIVVLAHGNEEVLARMNSVMRTIDLTTSILSPIIVGQIVEFAGNIYSAIFIGGWNFMSVLVEYYVLTNLYKQMPELGQKLGIKTSTSSGPAICGNDDIVTTKNEPHNEDEKAGGCWPSIKLKLKDTKRGWSDYFGHRIRNAGLALALLYMTVLGFDNITRGYALSQGVSESYLGIFTAAGAVFGILGSISFPYLRKMWGKLVTGNIGFGSETICLLACVFSIFTPGSPFVHYSSSPERNSTGRGDGDVTTYSFAELWNENISVLLLLIGIVTARFCLWVADLSVSQIFQESIAEGQRGILNGVQGSLNQGMDLIKFILVIVLPNPDTFAYLIGVSWLAILLGWVLFMVFSCHAQAPAPDPVVTISETPSSTAIARTSILLSMDTPKEEGQALAL